MAPAKRNTSNNTKVPSKLLKISKQKKDNDMHET